MAPRPVHPRWRRGAPSRAARPVGFAVAVSETRKQPKSKYTADRNIPGAFEGETVTRRRMMTLTTHAAGAVAASAFLLPALGFAAGSAIFERSPVIWTPVGKPEDFPNDDYVPRVITTAQGIGEVGKTTVYMR